MMVPPTEKLKEARNCVHDNKFKVHAKQIKLQKKNASSHTENMMVPLVEKFKEGRNSLQEKKFEAYAKEI